MLAILAFVFFVLYAVDIDSLGPFKTLGIGLAFLALAFVWNWVPSFKRA